MIVDLFAGPGGWDTGVRLASYASALVGIEHDMSACRTAVAAGHARICADVATYPTAPFVGKVDGLIGSPPCTTFSSAGQGAGRLVTEILIAAMTRLSRGQDAIDWATAECAKVLREYARTAPKLSEKTDAEQVEWARGQAVMTALVLQPLRWALALRPRWIALEQVPQVGKLWRHMAVLLREHGYRVWTGVLSSEEFGVAQTRKRAVLIARRDGLPVGPPPPTHQSYRTGRAPETEPDLFGDPLPLPVSMAEAIGWGMTSRPCTTVVASSKSATSGGPDPLSGGSGGRAVIQRQIAEGNWVLRSNYGTGGDSRDRGERTPDQPAATVTSKVDRNKWVLRNGNQANACARAPDEPAGTLFFSQRTNAVDWIHTRPATTVCGDARLGAPGHRDREGGERQFGEQSVRVTVQEAGVLQSFPADYPWQGTKSKQSEQVGNAIPPLLAAAILRPLLNAASQARAAVPA